MAKIRRGPGGKVSLGRNKSWAERNGSKPEAKSSAKESRASGGKWARNTKDATARAKKKGGKQFTLEDHHTRGKRIRDVGQPEPEGYMRTGGRYFAKIANMRPIKSKTSQQQRNMFYAYRQSFLGPKMDAGWMKSIGAQGMYDPNTGDANFRKTAAARRLFDADGGTYSPEYMSQKKKDGRHDGKTAGVKTRAKSRYIMAIGQDGHVR